MGHRELADEQAVDGCEERRVRADAEREGDQHDGGPALGVEEHARGVPEILKHGHLSRLRDYTKMFVDVNPLNGAGSENDAGSSFRDFDQSKRRYGFCAKLLPA